MPPPRVSACESGTSASGRRVLDALRAHQPAYERLLLLLPRAELLTQPARQVVLDLALLAVLLRGVFAELEALPRGLQRLGEPRQLALGVVQLAAQQRGLRLRSTGVVHERRQCGRAGSGGGALRGSCCLGLLLLLRGGAARLLLRRIRRRGGRCGSRGHRRCDHRQTLA
jgi:hypothetical protein